MSETTTSIPQSIGSTELRPRGYFIFAESELVLGKRTNEIAAFHPYPSGLLCFRLRSGCLHDKSFPRALD